MSNSDSKNDTIFGKIIAGELPATKIYEDDLCIAIDDINPQAPVHSLVIPRKPIPMLVEADAEDQALLGHLMLVAAKIARDKGIGDGFRTVINNGSGGGQTVFHLHVHILGGFKMGEGIV